MSLRFLCFERLCLCLDPPCFLCFLCFFFFSPLGSFSSVFSCSSLELSYTTTQKKNQYCHKMRLLCAGDHKGHEVQVMTASPMKALAVQAHFSLPAVMLFSSRKLKEGEGRERKDFLFPSPVASSLSPDGNNMSAKVLKVRRLKCVCTVGK